MDLLTHVSTHNQWYKLIIAELVKRQQKLEDWRKERQAQEMAQCLFKPELVSIYRAKKVLPLSGVQDIPECRFREGHIQEV